MRFHASFSALNSCLEMGDSLTSLYWLVGMIFHFNFLVVSDTLLEFMGCPDTHDTHSSKGLFLVQLLYSSSLWCSLLLPCTIAHYYQNILTILCIMLLSVILCSISSSRPERDIVCDHVLHLYVYKIVMRPSLS